MDGKGRFLDNIFVERLWRSPNRQVRAAKYECVYLHAWSGGREARAGNGEWVNFYNEQPPHAALGGRTPNLAYLPQADQADPDRRALAVA